MVRASRKPLYAALYCILLLLLLSAAVSAIGVSPGRKYYTYEEGRTETVTLNVLTDGTPTRISLYAQGKLAPHVRFNTNILVFAQGETQKEVTYTVSIPPGLDPGDHEADIVILELPDVSVAENKESAVVATTAVISKLQVNVPYPGKYIQGKLLVSEALANEYASFKIQVYNFGTVSADKVYARVEILGPTNTVVGEVQTSAITLEPKTEKAIVTSWLANVDAGRYIARVTLFFDGERISFDTPFNVGDLSVRMRDITVDPFKLGEIAKFNLDIQSIWNLPLNGVYADAEVYDQKQVKVGSFKSTSTNLLPEEEATLTAFWNTAGMVEGRYDIKFILHYGEKTTEKILSTLLTLQGAETDLIGTGQAVSPEGSLLKRDTILVALVIILVALNVFILYRFMLKKGSQ